MIWGPGGGLWLTAVWDQFGYDSSIKLIIVTRVLNTEFLGNEQLDLIIDRETLTLTPTIKSVTTSRSDYIYEVLKVHCLLFLYALYYKFDVLKDQCPKDSNKNTCNSCEIRRRCLSPMYSIPSILSDSFLYDRHFNQIRAQAKRDTWAFER